MMKVNLSWRLNSRSCCSSVLTNTRRKYLLLRSWLNLLNFALNPRNFLSFCIKQRTRIRKLKIKNLKHYFVNKYIKYIRKQFCCGASLYPFMWCSPRFCSWSPTFHHVHHCSVPLSFSIIKPLNFMLMTHIFSLSIHLTFILISFTFLMLYNTIISSWMTANLLTLNILKMNFSSLDSNSN